MSSLYLIRAISLALFHTVAVVASDILFLACMSDVVREVELSFLPISLVSMTVEGEGVFHSVLGLVRFGLIELLVAAITVSVFLFNIKGRILTNCLILAVSIFLFRLLAGDVVHSWYLFGLLSSLLSGIVIFSIGVMQCRKYNKRINAPGDSL